MCLIAFGGVSCAPKTIVVTPDLKVPERPVYMGGIVWTYEEGRQCLSDDGARNLLINIIRMQAHIEVLEAYIQAGRDD